MKQITSDHKTIHTHTHIHTWSIYGYVSRGHSIARCPKTKHSSSSMRVWMWVCVGNCQHFKADKSRVKRGKTKRIHEFLHVHVCVCVWTVLNTCVAVEEDTWGKILKIHEHAQDLRECAWEGATGKEGGLKANRKRGLALSTWVTSGLFTLR